MQRFLLLTAEFMLAGCSLSTSGDALDYAFIPSRSTYAPGDTLAATLVNRSERTMYLKRCPPAELVRVPDAVWQGVRLDFTCYQLRAVWTPVALEPGERYEVRLEGRVVEEARMLPNRYHLTLRIGSSKEEQTHVSISESVSYIGHPATHARKQKSYSAVAWPSTFSPSGEIRYHSAPKPSTSWP